MASTLDEAGVMYAAEHIGVVLSNERVAPSWFSSRTCPALTANGATTVFSGKLNEYMSALADVVESANVTIQSIHTATGAADSVFVTVSGVLEAESSSRQFTVSATLGESDAPATYYVVNEHFIVLDPVSTAEPEPQSAPVQPVVPEEAEAPPTPPQPSPEKRKVREEPAEKPQPTPEAPVSKPTKAESKPEPKAEPKAEEVKPAEKALAPPVPAAPTGPKPTGWAAVAAARKNDPLEPVAPKATPAPKEPAAALPSRPSKEAPAAAGARKEPPRAKEPPRKVECTAVFKTQGEVSDDAIMKALPPSLIPHVLDLRNKSADAAMHRVWIEFAIAGAVQTINESNMMLLGKPVVAEPPRKKNN